ncbi:MAG: hypothetical protein IPP79_21135, partial [Chitinophagaceae bacterium]|nr:hypothetical protein [Chitinophagaceae bacterium]
SNPASLNAVYTPSSSDILNGLVVLSINTYSGNTCKDTTDSMMLKIQKQAIANAGPDQVICNDDSYVILGASASDFDSLQWSHNGLGTLSGINTLSPVYEPAVGESGSVKLTLKVTGLSTCADVIDQMNLTINPSIILTTSGNLETCESSPVQITGVSAQNYSSNLWTSSGSGSFDNPAKLNPVYHPSTSDVTNGSASLTINVNGVVPCKNSSAQLVLTIVRNAIIDAGRDTIICNNIDFQVTGASASNYQALTWTIMPESSGTLSSATTLNPFFSPSPGFSGAVNLLFRATAYPACGSNIVSDQVTLEIAKSPEVDAGEDRTVPEFSSISLNGIVNGGSGDYSWDWKPNQFFVNPAISNPLSTAITSDMTLFVYV